MKKTLLTLMLYTLPQICLALDLTGTAYTIIYRGPTGMPEQAQPAIPFPSSRYSPYSWPQLSRPQLQYPYNGAPVAMPILQLMNDQTGKKLSSASFDSRLKGYVFNLPFNLLSESHGVCLLIKNASGKSLPMRDESGNDDGYGFRNALWEAELARVSELASLQHKLDTLKLQIDSIPQEIKRLQEDQIANGVTDNACKLQPEPPTPARPVTALSPSDAEQSAGGICAAKWGGLLPEQDERVTNYIEEAGIGKDWQARITFQTTAKLWNITPKISKEAIDAINKGKSNLEYTNSQHSLMSMHKQCRADIIKLAEDSVHHWEEAQKNSKLAPKRALEQCEMRVAEMQRLQKTLTDAHPNRTKLEQQISELKQNQAPADKQQRLDNKSCNNH